MPIVLEAADLVLIAGVLLLFGLLYALRFTIVPLLRALHGALGWVPFLGDLINRGTAAVEHGIADGIDLSERALASLWHGLTELVLLTGRAFSALVDASEQAFTLLRHGVIPGMIAAAVAPLEATLYAQAGRIEALSVELAAAEQRAQSALAGVAAGVYGDLSGELEGRLGGLGAQAEHDFQRLRELVQGHGAEVAAAAAATAGATLAAITAQVAVIEQETGLDNPACRAKLRGVCQTDPVRWARFLAGLAPFALAVDFRTLVRLGGEGVHELAPLARSFVAPERG